ncbi:hypothetical protein Tco_0944198 [Tanacetum coccineum]
MSHSTISYDSLSESLAESMGSSVASTIVPNHAPVASDFEPFEAPASPVSFDSDSVEPSFNSKPFSDYASPSISATTDLDNEPLGLPDTADYYGGSEFSEDDPSEDGSIDAPFGTDESPLAQDIPAITAESPPVLSPPIAPYRPQGTVQGLRKTLLPPRKRFATSKRIETLEGEVESQTARLAAAEIQIDAL